MSASASTFGAAPGLYHDEQHVLDAFRRWWHESRVAAVNKKREGYYPVDPEAAVLPPIEDRDGDDVPSPTSTMEDTDMTHTASDQVEAPGTVPAISDSEPAWPTNVDGNEDSISAPDNDPGNAHWPDDDTGEPERPNYPPTTTYPLDQPYQGHPHWDLPTGSLLPPEHVENAIWYQMKIVHFCLAFNLPESISHTMRVNFGAGEAPMYESGHKIHIKVSVPSCFWTSQPAVEAMAETLVELYKLLHPTYIVDKDETIQRTLRLWRPLLAANANGHVWCGSPAMAEGEPLPPGLLENYRIHFDEMGYLVYWGAGFMLKGWVENPEWTNGDPTKIHRCLPAYWPLWRDSTLMRDMARWGRKKTMDETVAEVPYPDFLKLPNGNPVRRIGDLRGAAPLMDRHYLDTFPWQAEKQRLLQHIQGAPSLWAREQMRREILEEIQLEPWTC